MQLIDTHSHLDTYHFSDDFPEVLERSRQAGVIAQILPGVHQSWWANLLEITSREHDLFAAIGLHPMYLQMHKHEYLEELNFHAKEGKLVGIGEIGLDYFIENSDYQAQQRLFEAQLDIAKQHNLPVLLHVRKAHDQVQATLRRKKFNRGGIVHAFSGSLQQAEKYLKIGFKISFGGTITYDRATKIRAVASRLPLHAIVLETDAPDIPPRNHHGERNSPEYLPYILQALGALRPESMEILSLQTTQNAIDILELKGLV